MHTVGAYRLLRQIGEGGMGVVHLALAPDGSRVAVKILRPQVIGGHQARERLEREVAAMRRVRSARVAECVDADPWGEPPFVVTRYVAGLSLTEYVAEYGPLDAPRLHRFAVGSAQALACVHAAGVLHRDIKPSNVLIDHDEPVLIDFGLAMTGDEARMTYAGWVFGTPAYLAPEVVLGDAPTLAVDIHGWAATVAFAATGRSPYGNGPSVVVLDRIRRGDFSIGGVAAPLADVLRRCLSPEAHQRPTAPELCTWLDHLTGVPAAGSPRQAVAKTGSGVPSDSTTNGASPPAAVFPAPTSPALILPATVHSATVHSPTQHGVPAYGAPEHWVPKHWAHINSVPTNGVGRPPGDLATPGSVAGRPPAAAASVTQRPVRPDGRPAGGAVWPQTGPLNAPPAVPPGGRPPTSHGGPLAGREVAPSAGAWPPDAWAGRPADASTRTRVLQWLAGLGAAAAVAAAAAIAPFPTTALVALVLVVINAGFATVDRRRRLEQRRGRRSRDSFVSVLVWPLRAICALPLVLLSCALCLGAATALSALGPGEGGAATVVGGTAFAALLWLGPAGSTIRRAGDIVTRALLIRGRRER